MRFHIKDSNIFPLPNNKHMLHLATIGYGLREFIVMTCVMGPHKGKTYIEEVVLNGTSIKDDVWANLKFIQDDNLAFDLAKYAEDTKLTDMKTRLNELGDRGKMSWLMNPGK